MDHKLKHLFVQDYPDALQKHYPDFQFTQMVGKLADEGTFEWGGPDRYQKPTSRLTCGTTSAWAVSGANRKRTIGKTYKGLLFHKPPHDLIIYSALIWESKPKTILEFGSMQGGSGVWFADQLEVLCGGGEVHSFELLSEGVSDRAKAHPRAHFHKADLMNLSSIEWENLKMLPHPWLVVDDSHVNVMNVLSKTTEFLQPGDYFIKEDTEIANPTDLAEYLALAESLGFLVDSIYADAFGYNFTSAQNTWFVYAPNGSAKRPDTSGGLKQMHWEPVA